MRLPGIVAIEGIDASGKATQAKMLADYLDALVSVSSPHLTGFPAIGAPLTLRRSFPAYDTPIGALIASKLKGEWVPVVTERVGQFDLDPKTDALVLQSLMVANKFELADEIERANVVEGRNVVLDRYVVSAYAYGQADGLPLEFLERLHARLPKAHHVLIDIPVEESFARRPKRDDKYEANRGRLAAARVNYLAYFESKGVDTPFWSNVKTPRFRTSPSGYAIVDGIGFADQVHDRVKAALGLLS